MHDIVGNITADMTFFKPIALDNLVKTIERSLIYVAFMILRMSFESVYLLLYNA